MQTYKGKDEQADVYARKHPCDNHLIWKRLKGTGTLDQVEKSKADLSWNSLEDEQGKAVDGGCIPNSLSTYEDGKNRSLRRKEKKEREKQGEADYDEFRKKQEVGREKRRQDGEK